MQSIIARRTGTAGILVSEEVEMEGLGKREIGGASRARTDDLVVANDALSQAEL